MNVKLLGWLVVYRKSSSCHVMDKCHHQSKIRLKCVIECQICKVNEWGTVCEIVHESKIRFECVIEWQICYVN